LLQYQRELDRAEAAAMGRLIAAWRRSFNRLSVQLEGLLGQVAQQGGSMTGGQLARMERYKSLIAQLAQELAGLQALTTNEVEQAGELGVALGSQSIGTMVSTIISGNTRLAAGFNKLPVATIKTLLGFLAPDGALFARLRLMAPNTAQAIADAIIQGVALGWNPRKIAAEVQRQFGMALSDALQNVRTVQIWAYREANRANMLANSDILTGWSWFAQLGDPRTCMSCAAMHGTVHPLSERLNDHRSGRCSPVPLVIGFDNPVKQIGTEWFAQQSEAAQRSMMGPGKYSAWKAGKFGLEQLSTIAEDRVYGPMRIESSLKELIGVSND
jgi:hypothetical protein